MRFLLAAILVTTVGSCTAGDRASAGECPANETCSDTTPDGLFFVGPEMAGYLFDGGPQVVAVGGTQSLAVQYPGGATFDLPYRAEAGGALTVAATEGAAVTLSGVRAGGTYLRIVDPADGTLYDRINVRAAELVDVALVSGTFEVTEPSTPIALVEGTRDVGIGLYSATERLVDESLTIEGAGIERISWDTVQLATGALGTYPLTVTAAGKPPVTLDVEIVAAATHVTLLPSHQASTYIEDELAVVCFGAYANVKQLMGLAWTFQLNGAVLPGSLFPNCAQFVPEVAGTYTIVAQAGGQSATAAVTVSPKAGSRRGHPVDMRAGERARAAN